MTNHDRSSDDDVESQGLPTMSLPKPKAPRNSEQPARRETADLSSPSEEDLESQRGSATANLDPPGLAEQSSESSPLSDAALTRLREQWDSVQSTFVDDPRECVQRADGLVSDVVKQLTAGFTAARSRLEERWGRGEEASTEDLRVALTRYRDFFERLLAV